MTLRGGWVLGCVAMLGLLGTESSARAERCAGQPPVLVVAQDWSGSMVGTIDGSLDESAPRKYTAVRSGLPDVLLSFEGDFQYALMMFPTSAGSCTWPATPDIPVDAQSNEIGMALLDAPSGRTPTADTLNSAHAYIQSLNLPANVPAHVVLVTDGLPNCNPALNPATCVCDDGRTGSGSYCANNSDANRCLDDGRTLAAAAALNAAGHRVYVVGFGSFVNVNNNAQVLNDLAAAGGTAQSYNATSPGALVTALSTVVTAARDCCTDACTAGQASCTPSGNGTTQCVQGAEGCLVWSTQSCSSGSVCSGGDCQSCTTTCTAGATQCAANGDAQTCVADANGCTSWASSVCSAGAVCMAGSCQVCSNGCQAGATRCAGNGSQTCVADAHGCTSWSSAAPCAAGTICDDVTGQCAECTSTCVSGAMQCADDATSRQCVTNANGCTTWQEQTCPQGQTCSGGTCASCNGCTAGETRCAGNTVQSCMADGLACTAWTDAETCGHAQLCQDGACTACPNDCEAGARDCQGQDVRSCVQMANGCSSWVVANTCEPSQVCTGGACCTNACEAGARRCSADRGAVEQCELQATGCTAWVTPEVCTSGTACLTDTCRETCQATGEGDSCPVGFECTSTQEGDFCLPVDPPASSSSGGNGNGGSGALGTGGGGAEDDEMVTGCGCELGDAGIVPAPALAGMLLAALWGRRRRR